MWRKKKLPVKKKKRREIAERDVFRGGKDFRKRKRRGPTASY